MPVEGSFPGYAIVQPLDDTGDFVLYRAIRHEDQKPVLLKLPASLPPSSAAIGHLEHEYEVAHDLDSVCIVRPLKLERFAGTVVLVLEDEAGERLADIINASPIQVPQFLKIAIGTAVALAEVHRHDLVHKDIKPANVWVDLAGTVKLTGFGVASPLPRERQEPESPEVLAGTLAYMAPEQTGRMNRSLDARSDLYALGVTFYEMIAGVLPFDADDPMEWIHCHIARAPPALGERVREIPAPLVAIIMKLLRKEPAERYQTAVGLATDLRRCLAEWETNGRIEPFALGTHDTSDRLLIPEKLYGREREIETLLAAFDRVVTSGTPELMLVSGYSGIGKTSVVNELHKALVPPRGLFAAGKFDQYKRNIPYATLGQAFRTLVRQILAKSDAEVARWREALQDALSPNGQVLIGLVPELEFIIGQQPPVPNLPPQEAQTRFQRVFRKFLGVFARPEHPLALFLDDLQWLDAATLQLLEHFSTHPDLRQLLLIGAYRDNEVTPSHPLRLTLDSIRKAGVTVQEIVLTPLVPDDVDQLVADSLQCQRERARPLARLIHEKTGGNPFFGIQFLTTLVEEKLLAFDTGTGRWTWDLQRLRAQGYTDNVVDIMVGKLHRLPGPAQDALKQLACLGDSADIVVLAKVNEASEEVVHRALWGAVRTGLVLRSKQTYTFLHDRVQEAAYSLIPESERATAHLRIGRLLLSLTAPAELEEKIFEIADHLNRGAELISDPEEKARATEINLRAARKAKASSAYASAAVYLAMGMMHLPANDDARASDRARFALLVERSEYEYLARNYPTAAALFEHALQQAETSLDVAAVLHLQMKLYIAEGRMEQANDVGLRALKLLGMNIPAENKELIAAAQVECQHVRLLRLEETEAALQARELRDPLQQMKAELLASLIFPLTNTGRLHLCKLVCCRLVDLLVNGGYSTATLQGCCGIGMVVLWESLDYEFAWHMGRVTLGFARQCDDLWVKSSVYHTVAFFLAFWRSPWKESLALAYETYGISLEAGNYLNARLALYSAWVFRLNQGEPVAELDAAYKTLDEYGKKFGPFVVPTLEELCGQFLNALHGRTNEPTSLTDARVNEEIFFDAAISPGAHDIAAFCKLFLCCLFREPAAAKEARRYFDAGLRLRGGLLLAAEGRVFDALLLASDAREQSGEDRQIILDRLNEHREKLRELAELFPPNFAHRSLLVEASCFQLEGDLVKAERAFEDAIAKAHEQGSLHYEGLASELAGEFYLDRGMSLASQSYLRNAWSCYLQWGAEAKIGQMQSRYPSLTNTEAGAGKRPAFSTALGAHAGVAGQIDLISVLKAAQSISRELCIDPLVETLLRIVIENAGAQSGCLLVPADADLMAVAQARKGDGKIEFPRTRLAETTEVAKNVVSYVQRTSESVILHDARADGRLFSEDTYLQAVQPKSVLCMPIKSQAKLIGILYLENNLVAGAFTPERLAVLDVLASQAAISLENATLYSDLQNSRNELRSQTLILRSVLDSIGDGVVVINELGEFILLNPAAEELLGFKITQEKPPERRQSVCAIPDQATPYSALELPLGRVLQGQVVDNEEIYIQYSPHPDGMWLSVTARPLTSHAGTIHGAVAVFSDITTRKRAEQEIRTLNAELEQRVIDRTRKLEAANKELESFSYSVSHDLRAPLRSIDGFSRILQEDYADKLDDQGRDSLGKIRVSTQRMSQLIDDMLQLSRVTLTELRRAPVDLSALVRTVSEELRRSDPQRPVEWVIEPDLITHADSRLMRIVFENLLGNAWKFTGHQSAPRIEFGRAERDGAPTYFVRDNGAGFDAQYAHKLFQAFQRLHTVSEFPGTGIGLATVQRVIHRHGGHIWAEGEPGHGATLFFTLPDAVDAT